MRLGRIIDLLKAEEARDEIGRFTSSSGSGYSLRRTASGGTDVHSDAHGRLGSLKERYAGAGTTHHHGLYVTPTSPPTPIRGPKAVSSDEPEHMEAQLATARKMAEHHEKLQRARARAQKDTSKLLTIGDLQKSDMGGDRPLENDEVALIQLAREIEAKQRDLLGQMQTLQSRMASNMTPEARAAASVMGTNLKRELGRVEEAGLQVQKRLIGVHTRQVRDRIAKRGTQELEREIATLKGYADAIEQGRVTGTVTVGLRRELVRNLMLAELELEAMR